MSQESLARELEHHEALYSGFAQRHFAKPAVRALRIHMVRWILSGAGAHKGTRVLSLGCGIGDTELLLAPHVGSITGIDLSPAAIRQAREDALQAGAANVEFLETSAAGAPLAGRKFDLVIGIFFLHHVPDAELLPMAQQIRNWLVPGGIFYGLDPSRYRLSGALGSLLVPHLMRRYQTPDERELKPSQTAALFASAGFQARTSFYDFFSTPLAGLLPSWCWGYRAARAADEILIRIPLLRTLGSNFELIATNPR
ncbi:MAG TPA: methyltransferase domain-containing protein [Bryobacteraceae bacterium]|nr:methyltransferase domain-containing protein [Bryobacteraceae bacterium]